MHVLWGVLENAIALVRILHRVQRHRLESSPANRDDQRIARLEDLFVPAMLFQAHLHKAQTALVGLQCTNNTGHIRIEVVDKLARHRINFQTHIPPRGMARKLRADLRVLVCKLGLVHALLDRHLLLDTIIVVLAVPFLVVLDLHILALLALLPRLLGTVIVIIVVVVVAARCRALARATTRTLAATRTLALGVVLGIKNAALLELLLEQIGHFAVLRIRVACLVLVVFALARGHFARLEIFKIPIHLLFVVAAAIAAATRGTGTGAIALGCGRPVARDEPVADALAGALVEPVADHTAIGSRTRCVELIDVAAQNVRILPSSTAA
eukprot:comp19017_c0_seq1/m.35113 comp19017_c0_seq1/g.35113  ORF comp19017_c0_seq1/g.35113 comp19017_c0_seq1/m.35113 type:complete len:326 (+) comp19017_c0_seq1:1099-2076(+)